MELETLSGWRIICEFRNSHENATLSRSMTVWSEALLQRMTQHTRLYTLSSRCELDCGSGGAVTRMSAMIKRHSAIWCQGLRRFARLLRKGQRHADQGRVKFRSILVFKYKDHIWKLCKTYFCRWCAGEFVQRSAVGGFWRNSSTFCEMCSLTVIAAHSIGRNISPLSCNSLFTY